VLDEIEEWCGFRTVEAREGRIYLNGRPIYLRGALDQAYYPETIYTPPSLEKLEGQFRQAKALGFNCLRCHIKIEDPRYYALADRLGLLIWAELPNWMHLSPAAAARAEATFAAMVERDWNHPSIIAWTLINEDWGTDLVSNDEHRQWLLAFFQQAKALDPTRLIVDNSPCHPNAHVISELEDYHHYRVIPDNAAAWTRWVADFAARPDWAWFADYAHLRRADAPLIVSEFGNWGLPDPAQLLEDGAEPWWFDAGTRWFRGQGRASFALWPHMSD
jgi:beta-galactosidase/beta-glucuronidase